MHKNIKLCSRPKIFLKCVINEFAVGKFIKKNGIYIIIYAVKIKLNNRYEEAIRVFLSHIHTGMKKKQTNP